MSSPHIPIGADVAEVLAALGGGGGGFEIGSSYLNATMASIAGINSGDTVRPAWTLASGAGSDLSINGGDSTKVDVATTGYYSVVFGLYFGPDAGTITQLDCSIEDNASDATFNVGRLGRQGVAYSYFYSPCTTGIPILVTGGHQLAVGISATTSAGTWTIDGAGGPPDLMIVRVA